MVGGEGTERTNATDGGEVSTDDGEKGYQQLDYPKRNLNQTLYPQGCAREVKKEEDGVGLPTKPGPLIDETGEASLEITTGKILPDMYLYLLKLSLRSVAG